MGSKRLANHLQAMYEDFVAELIKKNKEEIVPRSYELTKKKKIIQTFNEEVFSAKEEKLLLADEKLLERIYNEWLLSGKIDNTSDIIDKGIEQYLKYLGEKYTAAERKGDGKVVDIKELKMQLFRQMEAEYLSFIDDLLQKDKEEIIANAYKINTMQEILGMFDVDYPSEKELSAQEVQLLLTADKPLESIYAEWIRNDLIEDKDVFRITIKEYLKLLEEKDMNKEQIEILVVEPGKKPYVKTIDNSLQAMQEVVGGYIEPIYFDDAAIVVNEEGKVNKLPLNRSLYDESGERFDIIAGTFFVCGLGEEKFTSLNEKQKEQYAREFYPAEMFFHNDIKGELDSRKIYPMDDIKKKAAKNKEQER